MDKAFRASFGDENDRGSQGLKDTGIRIEGIFKVRHGDF